MKFSRILDTSSATISYCMLNVPSKWVLIGSYVPCSIGTHAARSNKGSCVKPIGSQAGKRQDKMSKIRSESEFQIRGRDRHENRLTSVLCASFKMRASRALQYPSFVLSLGHHHPVLYCRCHRYGVRYRRPCNFSSNQIWCKSKLFHTFCFRTYIESKHQMDHHQPSSLDRQ